jgi:hypothetical protein
MIEEKVDKIIEVLKQLTDITKPNPTPQSIDACFGINQNKRFVDNGDGTIFDTDTGVMWLQNANHFNDTFEWQDSVDVCAALDFAGHNDWRLPTVKEIISLIDYGENNPVLPKGHPFKNVQSDFYWSASSYVPDPHYAWGVYMGSGTVNYNHRSYNGYVWPVRISPDN